MKKKPKTITLIVTIIGLIYVCLVGSLQYNQAQVEPPKLTLDVSTAKTEYLQLEPVLLSLNLSNQTLQPISWNGLLMIGPNVNFVSRNAAGNEIRYEGNKYVTGLFGSSVKSMLAGEQIRQEILIDQSLAEILFPNPGQHTLQTEFVYRRDSETGPSVKINSNSISLSINAPLGINRQAYDYIKGPLETVNNGSDVRTIIQSEQAFVNQFRNTVYAKHISVSLARTHQTLGENANAFRELCKISNENFYYSKEVRKKVFELDAILRPVTLLPLPENVPTPIVPFPCTVVQIRPSN